MICAWGILPAHDSVLTVQFTVCFETNSMAKVISAAQFSGQWSVILELYYVVGIWCRDYNKYWMEAC